MLRGLVTLLNQRVIVQPPQVLHIARAVGRDLRDVAHEAGKGQVQLVLHGLAELLGNTKQQRIP